MKINQKTWRFSYNIFYYFFCIKATGTATTSNKQKKDTRSQLLGPLAADAE